MFVQLGTTFYTNPQFRISVEDPDSEDEDGTGTVIVGLMQKNRRRLKREGKGNLSIGYYIFDVSWNECRFFNDPDAAETRTIRHRNGSAPGRFGSQTI